MAGVTRVDAIQRAATALATGYRQLSTTPTGVAARQAYTGTGLSVDELRVMIDERKKRCVQI